MDEAIHRVQQDPATSHAQRSMGLAVRVLAQQRAIKEVKQQLRHQG
jgi:hypothetical protein